MISSLKDYSVTKNCEIKNWLKFSSVFDNISAINSEVTLWDYRYRNILYNNIYRHSKKVSELPRN